MKMKCKGKAEKGKKSMSKALVKYVTGRKHKGYVKGD